MYHAYAGITPGRHIPLLQMVLVAVPEIQLFTTNMIIPEYMARVPSPW
ncbi:hypothetical protein [Advenella kashmirensis]|nr:hypothetical protein [Advenella kashmirensis]